MMVLLEKLAHRVYMEKMEILADEEKQVLKFV